MSWQIVLMNTGHLTGRLLCIYVCQSWRDEAEYLFVVIYLFLINFDRYR